jgi:hypothetical protein
MYHSSLIGSFPMRRFHSFALAFAVLIGTFVIESPVAARPADQPFHKLRVIDAVDAPLLDVFPR